jgi:hypothetical protein
VLSKYSQVRPGDCPYNSAVWYSNRTVHIRHECRKTTVLSWPRCLNNTGVEKITTFKYILHLLKPAVSLGKHIVYLH